MSDQRLKKILLTLAASSLVLILIGSVIVNGSLTAHAAIGGPKHSGPKGLGKGGSELTGNLASRVKPLVEPPKPLVELHKPGDFTNNPTILQKMKGIDSKTAVSLDPKNEQKFIESENNNFGSLIDFARFLIWVSMYVYN